MSPQAAIGSEGVPAKRRQILHGAREVFAQQGYERASVDQIAARAGVSKATVYNHFHDKKALFVAAVAEDCDDFRAGLERCAEGAHGDVEQALQSIGERVMSVSLSPPVVSLYRQVIAEAQRLPELGKMVYERGTLAMQEAVAAHLRRWHDAGVLRVEDPRGAAVAFLALCQGDLVLRMRLGVLAGDAAGAEIRETVRRAVSILVRAHRP